MFNYNDPYFNENQIQPSILDITNQGSMQFPPTNQIYPNSFFDPDVFTSSNNQPAQQFSKGGQVRSWAEYLRRQGRSGDDMLAHINSGEAAILKALGGSGTRNPHTGLPEFFLGKGLRALTKPIGKALGIKTSKIDPNTGYKVKTGIGKVLQRAPAVIGSAVGSYFGGPVGSMIGGSVGGSMSRGRGNKFKGAGEGAGIGAAYAALAPWAGSTMGVSPSSGLGQGLGMNSPSLLNQLGMSSAPSSGGGLGFFGNGPAGGGIIGNFLGNIGGASTGATPDGGVAGQQQPSGSNWLNNALLATAILGTLGRKEKMPKEESMSDFLAKNKQAVRPEDKARNVRVTRRKYVEPPPDYRPGIDPEWQYYEDVNPEVQYYAEGGFVEDDEYFGEAPGSQYLRGGYLHGKDGGQDDTVPAKLSHGEFVFSAPAISILGGGNSNAGGRIASRVHDSLLKHSKKGVLPKGKSFADILSSEIKREFK